MTIEQETEQKRDLWAFFPITFLTAVFCCVLWGSATPAIKIAYELFGIGPEDTASRILLAGVRFICAGIMTIVFGSLIARKPLIPKKSSWGMIFILTMLQTVGQYYFFFTALANTSGVRGSIINAAGNFFTILMAVFVFRLESLSFRKMLGCVLGFLGIILILGGGGSALFSGGITMAGEGSMLIATLFYAASGCTIKIFSRKENPVVLSGYQFFVGGVILFVIGILLGGRLEISSSACILNLLYLGFISAGAYTLWGVLLAHNPVSRVAILGFINPVFGVLLSAVFLGEKNEAFSLVGLAALILVSLGIIIVNMELKNSSKTNGSIS